MRLLFIRHGDPDYLLDGLTAVGRREAELLAERIAPMEIAEYYVSPLGRAKATAAPTLEKAGRRATEQAWLQEFAIPVARPDLDGHIVKKDVLASRKDESHAAATVHGHVLDVDVFAVRGEDIDVAAGFIAEEKLVAQREDQPAGAFLIDETDAPIRFDGVGQHLGCGKALGSAPRVPRVHVVPRSSAENDVSEEDGALLRGDAQVAAVEDDMVLLVHVDAEDGGVDGQLEAAFVGLHHFPLAIAGEGEVDGEIAEGDMAAADEREGEDDVIEDEFGAIAVDGDILHILQIDNDMLHAGHHVDGVDLPIVAAFPSEMVDALLEDNPVLLSCLQLGAGRRHRWGGVAVLMSYGDCVDHCFLSG